MSILQGNSKGSVLLFLAAVIWGAAFVAQSVGMDYLGPFTFNGIRSFLGAVILIPIILHRDQKKNAEKKKTEDKKALWMGGLLCGICLCTASSLQQIGIQYTTAGKAGFLTAMYIVMVPILGVLAGKRFRLSLGVSIVLAVTGLYLLSIREGFAIQKGDIYVLLCAVVFSFHILIIDYFSPKCDGVKLSCIQFLVCGAVCTPIGWILEKPEIAQIAAARIPIAYAGIMSCGVAYTLQIIGQKNMNPTVASLILSLESVVSVLAGWIILKEALSVREMIGCIIMFAAIILAQFPQKD